MLQCAQPDAAKVIAPGTVRKKVRVSGIVQGVGFRPFVYRLAQKYAVAGFVLNTSNAVELEIEGQWQSVEAFLHDLTTRAPALAVLDEVVVADLSPRGEENFVILASAADGPPAAVIPADVALCPDCAREITDPADRRYHYAFTNCTNCGPRFTIIKQLPYDRPQTTMAGFPLCEDCRREYGDPLNRRFHAEPIACPVCGPRLWLEHEGKCWQADALAKTGELLRAGKIVAIKGLGGFHLACDAQNEAAVALLRQRKGRRDKPFAVMVRDLATAAKIVHFTTAEQELLTSPASPIVLLRRRSEANLANGLAPGNNYLGLLLPYTPLHLLLFQWAPPILVMTSGNRSEEPLAFDNEAARQTLAPLADAFLFHNRDIQVPCDDSVLRPVAGLPPIILRRARGYVPGSVSLPIYCPETILGVGAQDKNTFCLAWDQTAVLSQHIGDLDSTETLDYFRLAIDHLGDLCQRRPTIVAHDLHPGYFSTRYAQECDKLRRFGVQHHHAHIAACLAENAMSGPCLGLAFDGTGYGPDGTVWGGELLVADLSGYQRLGHLESMVLPGGDAAIRQPARMAYAYLQAAYGEAASTRAAALGLHFTSLEEQILQRQVSSGWQSPRTTSMGRLFDALAASLDICRQRTYEGQPALELEMAAATGSDGWYDADMRRDGERLIIPAVSLFRQAVEDYQRGTPKDQVASRFHESLARATVQLCVAARDQTGLNLVALSGGVWQNALLLSRSLALLTSAGFTVITHRQVPPNDGGIALGQATVAAALLARER